MENNEELNNAFIAIFSKIAECYEQQEELRKKVEKLEAEYEKINGKTQTMAKDLHLANLGLFA